MPAPMAAKIAIFPNGDDRPVEIDIEDFRLLVTWLRVAKSPEKMSLHEAAVYLVPAATMLAEALIEAGHVDLAGKLMWAAIKLRNHLGEDSP